MHIHHPIYQISGTTEKQIQGLLDMPSNNLIGKEYFNTSVNEKVDIFNRTIPSILSNFIPHEIIVFDDKYHPLVQQ